MTRKLLPIAASLAAAAAFHAAAAQANLGGQPVMHLVDAHHATLEFAADALPKKAGGGYDATIVFGSGRTVGALKKVGMHGTDVRYEATVTSRRALRVGTSYTGHFTLSGEKAVTRKVRLHAKGD